MSERKGDAPSAIQAQDDQPSTLLGIWYRLCPHWDAAVLPPPALYMDVRSLDAELEEEEDAGITVAEIRMEGQPQCAQCGQVLERGEEAAPL